MAKKEHRVKVIERLQDQLQFMRIVVLEHHKMSMDDVGKAIGVTRQSIYNVECGGRKLSIPVAKSIMLFYFLKCKKTDFYSCFLNMLMQLIFKLTDHQYEVCKEYKVFEKLFEYFSPAITIHRDDASKYLNYNSIRNLVTSVFCNIITNDNVCSDNFIINVKDIMNCLTDVFVQEDKQKPVRPVTEIELIDIINQL